MALDWSSRGLAAGLACYRNQEFFEAHEHWEAVWNGLTDPEKSFVQGLIQLTVAMHHFQHANAAGAQSLLRRALVRFDRCPESFGGVDVARLRNEVRAWVNGLETGASCMPAYPVIRIAPDES
jgi:uncharacterized protein